MGKRKNATRVQGSTADKPEARKANSPEVKKADNPESKDTAKSEGQKADKPEGFDHKLWDLYQVLLTEERRYDSMLQQQWMGSCLVAPVYVVGIYYCQGAHPVVILITILGATAGIWLMRVALRYLTLRDGMRDKATELEAELSGNKEFNATDHKKFFVHNVRDSVKSEKSPGKGSLAWLKWKCQPCGYAAFRAHAWTYVIYIIMEAAVLLGFLVYGIGVARDWWELP